MWCFRGGVTSPPTGQDQRPVEAQDFTILNTALAIVFRRCYSFSGEEHNGVIPSSRVLLTRRMRVTQEKIRVQICQQSENAAAGHLLAD